MRTRLRALVLITVATLVVFSLFFGERTSTQSQTSPGIPRRGDGKPDFSGIWQANNGANWDLQTHGPKPMVGQPGVYKDVPVLAAPVVALGAIGWVRGDLGVVTGDGEIPYQPWALKRKQENAANWLDRDPEIKCYMPGTPRGMYMPYPYQIVQGTNKIMMVFEFSGAQRTIHLDQVDPYPGEAYMGHSVGKWEGDTLVVTVNSFTSQTWLDRAGNFHSSDLKVTERYTPITKDAFQYEATIDDPKVYTRPWKISMPIYRRLEQNAQLMEFRCQEMAEETELGHLRKKQLVTKWEGKTMTVNITRKVPRGDALYERHVDGNPPTP